MGPLDDVPQVRARMALEKLADAGPEALRLFCAGHHDAAWLEVRRARDATNALMQLRRDARDEAGGAG